MSVGDPGTHVEESADAPAPIDRVGMSTAGFVGAVESGPLSGGFVRSWSEFTASWARDGALGQAAEEFFRNGGATAWIAPVRELTPDAVGGAIADMERDAALVAVASDAPAAPGVVHAAAEALATRRALLLVEGPWGDARAAIDAMTGDRESALGAAGPDVAVYWPRLKRVGASGASEEISPLGAVAGMIARTDAARGVHKAPGGSAAVLRGTSGTTIPVTRSEQDALNPLGVNVIRTLAPLGTVVWGSRTQALEGEWKYVPVRRTFLHIAESLDRGLGWVVFEHQNETLWQRVRSAVEDFLFSLFREGAFAGATPDEAYLVRCDRTTMTQDDIDRGELICLVGIAALKPAEFAVLRVVTRTAEARPEA